MPVEFDTIENAFLFGSMGAPFMNEAFVNRKTGDSYFRSGLGDSDELPEDIDDTSTYVMIPHKNDLDLGFKLVEAFAETHSSESIDEIYNIFRSKGAYGRFKAWLESNGLLNDWYLFQEQETHHALMKWCSENDIELSN